MPNFKVAVILNSSQVFIVKADNPVQAIEKISDAWDNNKIELDNPDYPEADFSLIGNASDDAFAVL